MTVASNPDGKNRIVRGRRRDVTASAEPTRAPQQQLKPLRNGTPEGDRVAKALAEIADDVVARLRAEGKPVPPELL